MWEGVTEHGSAKKTWKRKVLEEPVSLQEEAERIILRYISMTWLSHSAHLVYS